MQWRQHADVRRWQSSAGIQGIRHHQHDVFALDQHQHHLSYDHGKQHKHRSVLHVDCCRKAWARVAAHVCVLDLLFLFVPTSVKQKPSEPEP